MKISIGRRSVYVVSGDSETRPFMDESDALQRVLFLEKRAAKAGDSSCNIAITTVERRSVEMDGPGLVHSIHRYYSLRKRLDDLPDKDQLIVDLIGQFFAANPHLADHIHRISDIVLVEDTDAASAASARPLAALTFDPGGDVSPRRFRTDRAGQIFIPNFAPRAGRRPKAKSKASRRR